MTGKAVAVAIAILVACAAAAALAGRWRWVSQTNALLGRLEAARVAVAPVAFDTAQLLGLPPPVQRYLRAVLRAGQPVVAAANLQHDGTFNTAESGETWQPFVSSQRVIARRPGFLWDARIGMAPALAVHVHDGYVAGEGVLHAQLLGLLTVAEERGTAAVARGELMRYLAEAAWYPTVLLPGPNLRWEPIDERSARATLTDGGVAAAVQFDFGADGLIEAVSAADRDRTVSGRTAPTPWRARLWNYAERNGMRVPLDGEAMWVLPHGSLPYWRGHVTHVAYEFAR